MLGSALRLRLDEFRRSSVGGTGQAEIGVAAASSRASDTEGRLPRIARVRRTDHQPEVDDVSRATAQAIAASASTSRIGLRNIFGYILSCDLLENRSIAALSRARMLRSQYQGYRVN